MNEFQPINLYTGIFVERHFQWMCVHAPTCFFRMHICMHACLWLFVYVQAFLCLWVGITARHSSCRWHCSCVHTHATTLPSHTPQLPTHYYHPPTSVTPAYHMTLLFTPTQTTLTLATTVPLPIPSSLTPAPLPLDPTTRHNVCEGRHDCLRARAV